MPIATKGLNDSPTGPAVLSLLIVARDQPEQYRALQQAYLDSPQVLVILDERCADRRQQALAVPVDRRRRERRTRARVEEDLSLRQYIFARPPARRPKD